MEYALAAMVGAGAVAASLAWGWYAAGRRFEPVAVAGGNTPHLVWEGAQSAGNEARSVQAEPPASAAAVAARKLDRIVAENRGRLRTQNRIRSPRQS